MKRGIADIIKTLLIGVFAVVVFVECSVPREKLAEMTFNEAVEAYVEHRYNKAKLLLDSVLFTYSDIKPMVKQSKDMLAIIYRTEQERNLLFLDSLLAIRENEIRPLMGQFEVENNDTDNPVMIHKTQTAVRAWDRSYIRAHVDKNGTFFVSSHYTGSEHINHYAVRASVDDYYQQTDSIGDDAFVHYFEDGGTVWEVVKFKSGTDNGLGGFVASNFDKNVDVTFIGKDSNYKIRLTETDKLAFRDTYQLATMLRETVQIKSQIRNVQIAMKKKHQEVD